MDLLVWSELMVRRPTTSDESFKTKRTKHVAIVKDPLVELLRVQMMKRTVLKMFLLGG